MAYLLGEAWGQTIGTDAYPVLCGEKVYFDENAEPPYYNEKPEEALSNTHIGTVKLIIG